jgi:hypothetical protein
MVQPAGDRRKLQAAHRLFMPEECMVFPRLEQGG